MARNYQSICVTVLLSIALLFIAGVLLANHIASWNLKKPSILNSSSASLKSISKENVVSNQTDVGNSTNSIGNKEDSSLRSNLQNPNFGQLQTPFKGSRFKRKTKLQDNSNEIFSWNLKLNVSRVDDKALNEVTKKKSESSKGKHLLVAVNAESQDTKETALSELQKVLDSVGSFLKKTFGTGSENGINDYKGLTVEIGHNKKESQIHKFNISRTQNLNRTEKGTKQSETMLNQISRSFEVTPVPKLMSTQNSNIPELRSSSSNKSREGRIFFNIFGLGGKLLGRTTEVLETEGTVHTMDATQTETSILRNENLPDPLVQQKSEWVTKSFNRETSFHSDSLKSTPEINLKDFTNDHNTENLRSEPPQLLECSDCVTGGLELPIFSNKVEETDNITAETNDSTETLFTDDILEQLCRSLRNVLDETRLKPLNEDKTEAVTEDILTSIKSTPDLAQIDKQNRFFSLFDSGSGRLDTASDEKDLSEQMHEFSEFPSIKDCQLFFSKKQNINSLLKPGDIPGKEIFQNFRNFSEAPSLEELIFSSHLNSSLETFDDISGSTEANVENNKTSLGNERSFTVEEHFIIQEETTNSNFDLDNKSGISNKTISINEAEKSLNDRRDGKLLNFFGLGSGSDVQEDSSISERFISFFGSGARSLETFSGLEESDGTVDLGSGVSFQDIEGFSGDDAMLPVFESAPREDFSISSGDEPRFFNLLSFAGSGDGRELTKNTELITELSDNVNCSNCSHSDTERSLGCDDYECNFGSVKDQEVTDKIESATSFNESNCYGNCYPNTEFFNKDKTAPTTESSSIGDSINKSSHFYEKKNCDCFLEKFTDGNEAVSECDCSSDTAQASNVPYVNPENFSTETHVSKFSTGVKDEYGNCSDCSEEKLQERDFLETSTLVMPELTYQINSDIDHEIESLSHLNEVNSTEFYDLKGLSDSVNTVGSQQQETTEMKTRRFMETIFLTGSGDGGLLGEDSGPINLVEERNSNSIVHTRRRGRLDDLPIDECDDCGDLSELIKEIDFKGQLTSQAANHFNSTIKFDDSIKVSPISKTKDEETTMKTSIANLGNVTFRPSSSNIPSDPQSRRCIGAKDCNATLGERCITVDSISVCECGRTFVRQRLTRKCVAKRLVETTLKLPAEMFDSDLRNPESTKYKIMQEKSVHTMWLLLNKTPDIQQFVNDVKVAKFAAGSLIISLNLVIAVENELDAESIAGIERKLQKALSDENLMKRSSLNIVNATVLSITTEFDPCKSAELNHCSKNAYCKRKKDDRGSYTCHCKEHYLDVASNPFYLDQSGPLLPGEECIDDCPTSYCGPNGHCEIIENERHCLCNGMYFGERCEIPGMIILSSLSIAVVITFVVLCAIIIVIRCKRRSYGGSPTFRRNEDIDQRAIAAGRVSDAIALVENPGAKVSKFAQLSTPVPIPPLIKVSHPTFNDSSVLSFEYDSSFDTTH